MSAPVTDPDALCGLCGGSGEGWTPRFGVGACPRCWGSGFAAARPVGELPAETHRRWLAAMDRGCGRGGAV